MSKPSPPGGRPSPRRRWNGRSSGPAAYLAENHRLTTLTQEVTQITHWYELLGEALPALGMTPAKAAALAEDHTYNVAGNYTLLPGVREMLESLARQGYALGVISDTWPSVELQLPTYGIDHLLDARTFSFALGAFKPDASLYRDALAQLGLPGNACWFVDDRPCNLVGAEQAGMRGCSPWRSQGPGGWTFPRHQGAHGAAGSIGRQVGHGCLGSVPGDPHGKGPARHDGLAGGNGPRPCPRPGGTSPPKRRSLPRRCGPGVCWACG